MYEDYYGFVEKPFSLTPDPKYLYKSESHANAFELLQYAHPPRARASSSSPATSAPARRRCAGRCSSSSIARRSRRWCSTRSSSEDDLLRLILQDFGVVSRDEIKRGRLAGVSKQELIETLNDFLLSLLPLRATALLIIDEAQNLPRPVLEQIRILSNLETDKEKLLQIVLVGQLNLKDRAAVARAAPARSARVDPLRAEAVDARGDGGVRRAPADDRRRRRPR